ncbi:MAG: sugar transferase [Pseudomonadota bacterium]
MTFRKRLFDLVLATSLLAVLWPVLVGVALAIAMRDGRPILYLSARMKSPTQSFILLKFRTMQSEATDDTVSAGYKSARITQTGRFLRRSRLDELPQLFNILWGDMSFVGPRPPLPRYVSLRPEIYQKVLQSRPGVTGLASLIYHRHEEEILARCDSPDETHETYLRRCVPAKARLDLIWARHWTFCFDLVLILQTLAHFFSRLPHARRGAREREWSKNRQ